MDSPDPQPPPLPANGGGAPGRILGLEAWEHFTIGGALLGLMSAMTLPWGEWMSWTGGVVDQRTVRATESWDGWVYLLAVAAVAALTGLTALQRARGDGPQPRTFPLVYALALIAFLALVYFQFFGGPYASSSGGILFLRHDAPHGPYHVDIGWILSLWGVSLTGHGVALHRRDDRRKRREEAARASVANSGGMAGANS